MASVLVIDDEDTVLKALKAVLAQRGQKVIAAADARAGLAALKESRPDLVILDRELRGASGLDVLRDIRAIRPETRVILLSGEAESEADAEYRKLGVRAFLSKEIGIEILYKAVEAELARFDEPGRARVLVVDDDPKVRTVLKLFLERKGCAVATAADGRQGLAALEGFAPRVVLLDIDMPVLDGIEALHQIRHRPRPPAVIMISGDENFDTVKSCLELGASDYIVKPFNWEYLEMSVVAKVLGAR